jgi:hypothetical protein
MPTGSLIKRRGRVRLCKVKGFTVNYNAKHLVNFDVIRNMILNPKDGAFADSDRANREKDQAEKI